MLQWGYFMVSRGWRGGWLGVAAVAHRRHNGGGIRNEGRWCLGVVKRVTTYGENGVGKYM